MPRPWACAAVVFRDTGKVFRFPLDRPNPPPMAVIKREFQNLGVNVDDDAYFLEVLVKGFVEHLRPLQPADVRPEAQMSRAGQDTARWLMFITKVVNQRYWIISATGNVVIFQPIQAPSLEDGVAAIESIIADSSRLLPGHVTIH